MRNQATASDFPFYDTLAPAKSNACGGGKCRVGNLKTWEIGEKRLRTPSVDKGIRKQSWDCHEAWIASLTSRALVVRLNDREDFATSLSFFKRILINFDFVLLWSDEINFSCLVRMQAPPWEERQTQELCVPGVLCERDRKTLMFRRPQRCAELKSKSK